MAYRKYGALIASLGVAALVFAADEAFARSGAAPHGVVAAKHPIAHSQFSRFNRFNRFNRRNNFGNNFGAVWPAYDDSFYGPSTGQPPVDITQPIPSDIRNSQAYDIPWDWAHRYPPLVTPGDKPYVSTCPSETVKVPGHNGNEQTVNIMRCY
jgi:hypothetical protein